MVPVQHEENSPSDPFRQKVRPLVIDSEHLIRQAFEVDVRRGYDVLFRRYYRVLCSQAVRFVYSREIAQDIVGEIFLNFWKNQVHLHIATSYRSYLFTAVRNRVRSHLQDELRRESAFGKPTDACDDASPDDDPQQILQFAELANRVETEIGQLSPQCQRVFLMSRFEDKKHREIADELQISTKTVEAHLFKALTLLRNALRVGLLVVSVFCQLGDV